uniref:hypothetical protein n=1 Tax=Prevotella sp. TaxID=59823 RepID=UPI004025B5E6
MLCFKDVCRNQANTKENAEKHKQHTHLLFTIVHVLVLLKGVEQVPLFAGAKVVQIEDNTKRIPFFFIVEMKPTLSKGSANRRQYKKNSILFYC